jgi:hypothetical protein
MYDCGFTFDLKWAQLVQTVLDMFGLMAMTHHNVLILPSLLL